VSHHVPPPLRLDATWSETKLVSYWTDIGQITGSAVTSWPSIVHRTPDSIASLSVSKLRSSEMLILVPFASKNLRNRWSVAEASPIKDWLCSELKLNGEGR
jgi:hypothetical protein